MHVAQLKRFLSAYFRDRIRKNRRRKMANIQKWPKMSQKCLLLDKHNIVDENNVRYLI